MAGKVYRAKQAHLVTYQGAPHVVSEGATARAGSEILGGDPPDAATWAEFAPDYEATPAAKPVSVKDEDGDEDAPKLPQRTAKR